MANFLLVHGAFQSAWCWHAVIARLEALGHRVMAPELPSSGLDALPFSEGGLVSAGARVRALLDVQPGPTLLVGHGVGGAVCTQAADGQPDRVSGVLHLSGLLLRAGESVSGVLGESGRLGFEMPTARRIEITDQGRMVRLPADAALELLFHRCPPALAQAALSRLRPQPTATYTDPIKLASASLDAVPRYYLQCGDDRAVPPALQRWMTRRVPCRHVYWIDSDHSPFLSAPDALVAVLVDAAERCSGRR